MSKQQGIPSDAPPSYTDAVGGASKPANAHSNAAGSNLTVPGASSSSRPGMSAAQRRSMEDESRPLPKGWVRTYDPQNHHQFFVDTAKDPPRSIWHHPYDDEEYLSTLTSEERERIEQESMHRGSNPSKDDIMAAHSEDDEEHEHATSSTAGGIPAELPPRPDGKGKGKATGEQRSFGRKFKDKVTGTTHAEREAERARRAEQERKLEEQHRRFRAAMAEAARTNKPVKVGVDKNGKDVWVEPPPPDPYLNGGGYGGGYGGYGPYSGGYGYSPYSSGLYSAPVGRYASPAGPYGRPYGGGYGGGYGLPLALGGGLLGGLLLGDILF